MRIDRRELSDHYASLTDEELLALDPSELTDVARKYYDAEVARRKPDPSESGSADGPARSDAPSEDAVVSEDGAEPDWLEDAACVISYALRPGSSAAPDADDAREALVASGIPCCISLQVLDPDEPAQQYACVMVPGARNLEATSVLERDIQNPKTEALWRTHFAELSDDELRALKFETLCAGLEDRLARLKRAYQDEITQRGLP